MMLSMGVKENLTIVKNFWMDNNQKLILNTMCKAELQKKNSEKEREIKTKWNWVTFGSKQLYWSAQAITPKNIKESCEIP